MAKDLKENVKQTMNACEAMNIYYKTLVEQPVIESRALPQLTQEIMAVRAQAEAWPSLWKQVYGTAEDIVDFGNEFSKLYKELLANAEQLSSSKDEERSSLSAKIKACLSGVVLPLLNTKLHDATAVKEACQKFQDEFTAEYGKIKGSLGSADNVIREYVAEIEKIHYKIEELKKESLFIPFMVPQVLEEIKKLEKEIAYKKEEVSRLKMIIAILKNCSSSVLGFSNGSAAIHNSWINISQSMNETIGEAVHALSDTALAVLVTSDLKTMNDDWQDTTAYVKNLLPKDGALPNLSLESLAEQISRVADITASDVKAAFSK